GPVRPAGQLVQLCELRRGLREGRHDRGLREHERHPRDLARRNHRDRQHGRLRDRPVPVPRQPARGGAVPRRDAHPGRHEPGGDLPDHQRARPLQLDGGADSALHGHRHHLDLHLHPVHAVDPDLDRRGRHARRRQPLDHLLARDPADAAAGDRDGRHRERHRHLQRVLSAVPVLAVAGGDLDLAVPLQGSVRRALGDHRRRNGARDRADPPRVRVPAALHLPRARVGGRQVRARELHSGWTVRAAGGPAPATFPDAAVPAVVPGVVHQALLGAGLIPDPYLDDNESALAWIGLVDWTYELHFDARPEELAAEQLGLAFDGLYTVATVSLNGQALAEVANQHRRYRLDVTGLVQASGNHLVVAFRSPVRYANAQSLELGARPRPYPMPFEAIRKAACNFGWDWGIASFTSGIWRPVRLEAWSTARLAEVRVAATPTGDGGVVPAEVEVVLASDDELTIELEVAGVTADAVLAPGKTRASVRIELASARRWWPVGYGEQPLY